MTDISPDRTAPSLPPRRLAIFCGFLLLAIAGFIALGVWQVERLFWKQDLIARVAERINAVPVPAPLAQSENLADQEYRRVTASGTFDHGKETLVYAATELGAGYWVMTPLTTKEGMAILVNRGFVPTDRRVAASRASGQIAGPLTITGLLRMSEPEGSLLQANRPAEDRWYSRDVGAIASARGIARNAGYFIDADSTPNPGGLPVGGMTRIDFPNSHLSYAVTWFAMALLTAGMLVFAIRGELKNRRH
jgi:surfeit locus 1 family protein